MPTERVKTKMKTPRLAKTWSNWSSLARNVGGNGNWYNHIRERKR